MRFAEIPYERPDMAALQTQFEELLRAFPTADAPGQVELIRASKKLRAGFMTQQSLCHIRHTSDTRDGFYEAEQAFFDEAGPRFEALVNRFAELLVGSRHRAEIEALFGPQFLRRTEVGLRAFDPATVSQLADENQLASAYTKIKARAEIPFRGKTYNLSTIHPLTIDPDRVTRREAATAHWAFFAEHEREIARNFDALVDVRTAIARQMGHADFVALGYDRMARTDYGPREVAQFRAAIREHVVPVATRLYGEQARRLGLDSLKYYDEGIAFPQGNPTPRGTPAETVAAAGELYAELSPETDAFYALMRERDLMDLVARDGKATGGYCTYLYTQCVPYIFSNFNGTSGDIDVLTHELGHAFQMYESRRQPVLEYILPTYEACEIHSMAMEFFAYPWMESFFGDGADDYRRDHLETAIKFLPYIAAVDEFQHRVYAEPELGIEGRMALWRELEAVYLPHRDYDGNALLERGGLWLRQSHIFQMPFYYIDYALAQVCALQLFRRDQVSHRDAWGDYLKLCRAGGSGSFLELVRLGNLRSPFEPGVVREVVAGLGLEAAQV